MPSGMPEHTPETIIGFWFSPRVGKFHWGGPPEFDQELREAYLPLHEAIVAGEHRQWLASPEGTLATILCLDQFSRNMFRGTARAFATDGLACWVLRQGLARGLDRPISPEQRSFMYMPLMHSEQAHDQQQCIELMATLDRPQQVRFAYLHKDIIDRFGRFPHRNATLGRVSTPDEHAFLTQPGSRF